VESCGVDMFLWIIHPALRTWLNEPHLPYSGFTLNMGCLHRLSPHRQQHYAGDWPRHWFPGVSSCSIPTIPGRRAADCLGCNPRQSGLSWSPGLSSSTWALCELVSRIHLVLDGEKTTALSLTLKSGGEILRGGISRTYCEFGNSTYEILISGGEWVI